MKTYPKLWLVALMMLAGAGHAQTVAELSGATTDQLTVMQQKASADLANLQSVLKKGVKPTDVQDDKHPDADAGQAHVAGEAGVGQVKEAGENKEANVQLRPEHVREDEDSYATTLPVAQVTLASREFAALRKFVQTSHQPDEILTRVQAFVASHPNHRDARLLLARRYMLARQTQAVYETLEPLLAPAYEQNHPDWQPWFWAGSARLAEGDVLSARNYLELAVSKDSSRVETWVQLAVLEQEMNNHAGALQYLDIAAQLDAEYADVYLNRAYSFEHLGDFARALKAYQQFLVAHSQSTNSLKPTVLRRITLLAQQQTR